MISRTFDTQRNRHVTHWNLLKTDSGYRIQGIVVVDSESDNPEGALRFTTTSAIQTRTEFDVVVTESNSKYKLLKPTSQENWQQLQGLFPV